MGGEIAEDRLARGGPMDDDHATIVLSASALDETALLQSVDDPGHAGNRDVESLG
jgi:hypothetical protein